MWQTHGGWVQQQRPAFGPGIQERFEMASKVTAAEFEAAVARRAEIRQHMLQVGNLLGALQVG